MTEATLPDPSTVIRGASDAHALIRGSMDASPPDAPGRPATLIALLEILTRPANLSAMCTDLLDHDRFADFAYLHNNGFYVLFVADPDLGYQTRLHVWPPRAGETTEHPHRHRMAFASKVLAGELSSTLFNVCDAADAESGSGDGGRLYDEAVVDAPASTDFAHAHTALQARRRVVLRERTSTRYATGDSYYFPAVEVHKVDTPPVLDTPIVTMTLWEMPCQESIAYEPAGTFANAARKRLPVKRLTRIDYRDLLQSILATLSL